MPSSPARLLCIGEEPLKLRCAVLASAGYDAKSATVAEAEILLRTEKFDLVIVSVFLSQEERFRVTTAAGDTPTLMLDRVMFPVELFAEVDQHLI
jgi:hypothetical protein